MSTRLARRIIDRYDWSCTNHFSLEEEILFPACASPLTDELTREHREMESLVEGLRTHPTAGLIEQFMELLRRHIRREEEVLFESVQKELSREVFDELGRKIDAKVIRVCL